jgi:MarR family transcriptional regulator, organic hydroperoxide resistance regulator
MTRMKFERSLGYLVRYAHRAFVKALANELVPFRISTSEWAVFRVLWAKEGYSQVELARRMRVEKASLTGVLNGMERRGLLVRKRDASDRRRVILTLTPHGRSLKRRVLSCAAAINRRATRGLSGTQVAQMRSLLTVLTANLESEEARPRRRRLQTRAGKLIVRISARGGH